MASKTESPSEAEKQPAAASGGGLKTFLPLIANIVLMPALAFGVAHFYLLPKLQGAKAGQESAGEAKSNDSHAKPAKGGKAKFTAPLGGKVLVNVAGTAGTRYLVANLTLVSGDQEIKSLVETHDAELRDAAAGVLASKTIQDLEKPEMRNIIRTELIGVFNDILGKEILREIYLTEFAIQ
ncbi:MAG TPA: flagellar basal body-associated FliL family protein [Methylomirabilota bacterium]|nr:flagellar basal body-associated FliL family protein [Methylomirabilota bacterium]